jgi:hypothetical protein
LGPGQEEASLYRTLLMVVIYVGAAGVIDAGQCVANEGGRRIG